MDNKKVLLSINVELWQWIKEESQKENRSVNNYIETKLMQSRDLVEAINEAIKEPSTKSKWQERLEAMQKRDK